MNLASKERSEYYQEIARYLILLRRSPILLSSEERECISRWDNKRIPLSVVREGIRRAYEIFFRKRGPKRKTFTLNYCNLQVQRAFEMYLDRRVGGRKKGENAVDRESRLLNEVKRFLRTKNSEEDYLESIFRSAEKNLGSGDCSEELLENLDREVEALLWKFSKPAEREKAKREILSEIKTLDAEEMKRIIRIKTVKTIREAKNIPYLSLFYYG
ncbi:MAG: hypothetical protein JXB26_07360 [Candidatus Aminicenantes bacterium]|nr:hypothetical protein [Candidatus Aminicenantes bacterium]